MRRAGWVVRAAVLACCWIAQPAPAQGPDPGVRYGPYDAEFTAGGDGLIKGAPADTSGRWPPEPPPIPLVSPSAWSLHGWVWFAERPPGRTLVGGLGDPSQAVAHYLGLDGGKLLLWMGENRTVDSSIDLAPGAWHFIAATSDGSVARLFANGREIARGAPTSGTIQAIVQLAPRKTSMRDAVPFAGRLAGFTALSRALSPPEITGLSRQRPRFDLVNFESGSPGWPVQVRQMYGQTAPQPPATLPKSKAPFTPPAAKPAPVGPALSPIDTASWTIGGWRLAEAPKVSADAERISRQGFDASSWYVATVPGTVLTTLIDRSVYPDPDYGLDNLAIPESLNKQDYWYRTEFEAPRELDGRHLLLTLHGVNYASDVWLNGTRLGGTKGAFIRGQFDVTGRLKPGAVNVIAVRVSPPPHPGIPHEESMTAGVGENGGMLALDGPTFMASEGWDWIPSVRDRNTGLWRGVTLDATGPVRIGDAQVVTTLPLPDNSRAEIEITVPLENLGAQPAQTEIRAAFDEVSLSKSVPVAPGRSVVKLTVEEFPRLAVPDPRLWWPNGYGEPALHELRLSVSTNGAESDRRRIRFGIRQVTYELSLFDAAGNLRRVEVDLSKARSRGERIVDVSHEAIRKVPDGWAASLRPGAQASPAVRELRDKRLAPHLVIKVNGVRIAAKGGNWGMDDWRKRVSREKLEPYFRLHRDANLNTIRNWVGQNTEDTFYELADEYGLMVLNDFWASTQDYQLEPQDVPLFLENAADVIRRYRNHPSIVLWFGRNEGVPQPILNEGLDRLVAELDGTRYYTGSSNRVNLAGSGPYDYREPESYFTRHARGFSVEVGTPSFPTLESFKRWIPEADRWPIGDVWAYHDWHQSGNGDTRTFMTAMQTRFGAATSLEDFERKAQMMNYVTYRAMFEGMNAHLWSANSGRLLWMTQPAWPSTMWQILSADYDTHGAFYGVKKASEPVHVQMNLPGHDVIVVNNTTAPLPGTRVHARVFSLDNKPILERETTLDAAAVAVSPAFTLDLTPGLRAGVVLVKLEATDAAGKLLSENFYWQGQDARSLRQLNGMARTRIDASAQASRTGDETRVRVRLRNAGAAAALATKITLSNADGSQILPAYLSDNYVSLLPGETRDIEIEHPAAAARGRSTVAIRGWNVEPAAVAVTASAGPGSGP